MENTNMNDDNFCFNVKASWFATLVVACSFGIYLQTTKPSVKPIKPITPIVATPIAPLQPENECARNARCNKVAEALVYEARGEPDKGQIAVAHVILNRMKDSRWPNRVIDVIHQPNQFSYLKDKHKQTKPTTDDWNRARKIAYNAINGHISSPVGDATHYHAKHVKPKWAKKLERVAVIGRHVFYR